MLSLSSSPTFIKGAAHGINGSFIRVVARSEGDVSENEFAAFRAAVNGANLGVIMPQPQTLSPPDVVSCFMTTLDNVLKISGQPFPLQYMRTDQGSSDLCYLVRCPQHLRRNIIHYLHVCFSATVDLKNFKGGKKTHWSSLAAEGAIPKLLNQFSAGPPTPYSLHLLRAAIARNIPCTQIEGETWRLGIASKARMTTGTMSDQTSVVGVNFARNKMAMARLLERNGLPNLGGISAATPAQAVKAAKQLGFPVVVKPLALDGGIGVACDLKNEDEVEKHTADVLKKDKNVIVQRFLRSQDYRATVVNGEVIWLVQRIPGGVVGDGKQAIGELINLLNAAPNRGSAAHLPLNPLKIDEEARRYLKAKGLTLNSVLPAGEYLQLRGAANIASGGHHIPKHEQAHPDNIRLAALAAQVFRLDFAGVDLLLPDITRSYRETGGAVCEVNAQPAIVPAQLYTHVVDALVSSNGRVPIIFLISGSDAVGTDAVIKSISERIPEGLGLASDTGIFVNEQFVAASRGNCFDDLEILFNQQSCHRILYVLSQEQQLKHGLPIDKIDAVFLTTSSIAGFGNDTLARVLNLLHRHVTGPVCITPEIEQHLPKSIRSRASVLGAGDQLATITTLLVGADNEQSISSQ